MRQLMVGFASVSVHLLETVGVGSALTMPIGLSTIREVSTTDMRKWLSGRASPCQGEGREFESRLPLQNGPSRGRFFMSAIMEAGADLTCGTGGMADAAVLKTVGETRPGSSPGFRTISHDFGLMRQGNAATVELSKVAAWSHHASRSFASRSAASRCIVSVTCE